MNETATIERAKKDPRRRGGRPSRGESLAIRKDIIATSRTLQNATQQQIADTVGVARQTVADVLAKYAINQGELDAYRDNQGDILLGLQHNIVRHITTEKLEKTSVKDLAICLGIAVEKHRLVTGQSTVNMASIVSIATKAEAAQAVDMSMDKGDTP